MDDRLKHCPFCGAGETLIQSNKYWTGMRNEVLWGLRDDHACALVGSDEILKKRKAVKSVVQQTKDPP